MRVHVDTVDGGKTYRVQTLRQLAQLLLPALEAAEADMRAGAPDPYVSGVVFKREAPPSQGVEWWKRPARTLSCGGGDCDDLAPWRAASLRVSGEDPDALPVLMPVRPGLVHVLVRRGDGSLEDPSRVLGMGGPRVQPKYQIRKLPRRGYQAMLRVPTSTAVVRGYGRGPSGAEALSRASDAVVSGLWKIGCIEDPLVEGTQDTVDAAVYAAAGALAAIAPWGTLAGAILAGVYKLLGPYFFVKPYEPADDYPKAIAAAKGIALPGDGKDRAANIAACIAGGWLPIYCSDSEGTRNNIAREFEIRGWFGGEKWSNRHGAEITTSYTWWYGVHFPLAGYPSEWKAKAIAKANADASTDTALKRMMSFITNAKARMRTYGGDEDYDRMIIESWPMVPSDAATEDRQVTVTPRADAGTLPPAAVAPPASSGGGKRPASAPPMSPAAFAASRADAAALGSSTPTVLTPMGAEVINATRQLTDLGRAGDWYALARLAGAVQREGQDGVMQRMARALINTRR